MPKDWICDSCGYSNSDDTTTFCGRCGSRRHFIKLNYRRLKVSPGSALYVTSTTADNAAAMNDSINLYKELQDLGYPVHRYVVFRENVEKLKQEVKTLEEKVQETAKQGETAILDLAKEQRKQYIKNKIIEKMSQANYLFQDRYKAELFKLDNREILDRLGKASVGKDDFVGKIASLASLFQVKLDPLRRLVPNPDSDWKSITLVEKMLENEKVQFDPEMIETWRNIVALRDSTPIHPDKPPISALEFFGEIYPDINYERLWDTILKKFLYSLETFVDVLAYKLPKK